MWMLEGCLVARFSRLWWRGRATGSQSGLSFHQSSNSSGANTNSYLRVAEQYTRTRVPVCVVFKFAISLLQIKILYSVKKKYSWQE